MALFHISLFNEHELSFQVYIRSESWTYYNHNSRCYWSFYAPGAKYIQLQLQYWNIDCPDDLNVYIGTSTSSYHSNVICGEDTNGNTWNYDTDMLYLYWYTNSYDNERGFYGYVRRVD